MKILNYILEVGFHAKQSWTHFRVHKSPMHRHLVWGRLSVIFGQPHLEEIGLCTQCGSTEIGEVGVGDEGWTVCRDCNAVEQGYEYVTLEEAERRGIL